MAKEKGELVLKGKSLFKLLNSPFECKTINVVINAIRTKMTVTAKKTVAVFRLNFELRVITIFSRLQ